jgi:multiple sugar transport system permease protein
MTPLTRHSRRPRRSGRFRAKQAILYGLMLLVLIAILAPFAWLLISSVSRPVDLLDKPLRFIPSEISLDRFAALTIGADADPAAEGFRAAMLNSLTIATVVTGIALVVGVPAAYAFARLRFPGRGRLVLIFMATYMLPPIALVIPLYQIMSGLDLLDSKTALIIIYSSFVTPFVIWIMRGYIESISPELDDAARVDGCSRLGALIRVILPISAPGLISTGLLAFLLAWDEFFYALVMTQTNAAKTVPVALNDFIGRHGIDFGMLAAGGVIAAIPPVVIAFVFQRHLVAGLTAGGVKG